jgi:hypothetical protein
VARLAALERTALAIIQWMVFGGVFVLTVGAGALSWEHLTHIAATNGHIAPKRLLFLEADRLLTSLHTLEIQHAEWQSQLRGGLRPHQQQRRHLTGALRR